MFRSIFLSFEILDAEIAFDADGCPLPICDLASDWAIAASATAALKDIQHAGELQ